MFSALDPEASTKLDIDEVLKRAIQLRRTLNRHIYDEEDFLIPATIHGQEHL